MKLMTKELTEKFPVWGSTAEKTAKEMKVVAKFFNPGGAQTWYAVEFDGTDTFFGYVTGMDENELGNFSLSELSSVRGRFGLKMERDLHWNPETLLSAVMNGEKR